MIKFLFMLVLIGILFMLLVPLILKAVVKNLIGKATQRQQRQYQQYNGNDSQSSYSSAEENDESYYGGSVLVHDEDSARRMKRMKAEAEDVEAVIIDEPIEFKEKEKEKGYR